MNTEEFIIFAIGIAAIINVIIVPPLLQLKQDTINFYLNILPFIYNSITLTAFSIFIIETLVYLIYKKTKKEKEIKIETENNIKRERDKIEHLLNKDLKKLNHHQLIKLYYNLEDPNFNHISIEPYKDKIEKRLKDINHRIIVSEEKRELDEIKEEKEEAKQELEIINAEIEAKRDKEEKKKDKIRRRLKVGYKDVYKRENLTQNEIKVIKEEEYEPYDSVNEYSIVEKKIIPVLVRRIQHHSPTHTFLVWDVKNFLKRYNEIESIIDHETRNADITFRIKRKIYAVEIEKGSLLRKPKQLKQKIDFLNEEYGTRWIILVSNRDLAKEYRKYGKVTTRKNFQKHIEKWIKEAKYT